MSAPPAVDATRRTRLANERTFLAWWRTALACEGLAIAVGKVLPEVAENPDWPYLVLGSLFSLLGVAVAGAGWWRQATVDRALTAAKRRSRRRGSSPRSASCCASARLMIAVFIVIP